MTGQGIREDLLMSLSVTPYNETMSFITNDWKLCS